MTGRKERKMIIKCKDDDINRYLEEIRNIIPDDVAYATYMLQEIACRVNYMIDRLGHAEVERFKEWL